MNARVRPTMPCLQCGETMEREVFDGQGQMWKCSGCTGMWLDTPMVKLLTSADLEGPARDFIRRARKPAARPEASGYRNAARVANSAGALTCPECEAQLETQRTNHRQHGVDMYVDVCEAHGVWFDKDEAVFLLTAVELKRLEAQMQRR